MKIFAAKIKQFITRRKTPELVNMPLDFVRSQKGILRELTISQHSGNLIGIYSRSLGEGMFLTTVESIDSDGEEEIAVFKRYDASGQILSRTRVSITEIRMVCPFNKIFQNALKQPKPNGL